MSCVQPENLYNVGRKHLRGLISLY